MHNSRATLEAKRFPDDFLFGASTSAFQTEGAWNVGGKGPSILDASEQLVNHQIVGDVGANSYEYYLDDIKAIKELNVSSRLRYAIHTV